MQVFYNLADFRASEYTSLTIGKFDGLHRGHQKLINTLLRLQTHEAPALVLTFDRDPRNVLQGKPFASLVTLDKKLDLLQKEGVPSCVVLRFDKDLASIPAESFLEEVLIKRLKTKRLLVGEGFRFGAARKGNIDLLRKMSKKNFELVVFEKLRVDNKVVSSTWIRELLLAGDVESAASLLGRYHLCGGIVVPGRKNGRKLGCPTVNLSKTVDGLIPADGIYIGHIFTDKTLPAVISVGNNPTLDERDHSTVEAHALFEEDIDLYGKYIEVHFIKRLRDMVKFDSIEMLKKAIYEDIKNCKAYFANSSL